jgi:hypothetical protein
MTAAALAAAFSPGAQACAVCFGKTTDSRLGDGFNWGVLALLGFIFGVLGAISAVAFLISRRAAAIRAADLAEGGSDNEL